MPKIMEMERLPRRALHVFYILDTSRSMEGKWIEALNKTMRETTDILRRSAETNADAQLKIAVLEFNSGCEWLQPLGPENMEDFIWEDLSAGGLTDMGAALKELDSKLSVNKFLSSATGMYFPIIIFMTDGYATDNYKKALSQIRKNKWFTHAVKIGFALGDFPDIAMIADIAGHCEAVVQTADINVFERLLRYASITSSMMSSKSQTAGDAVTGGGIIEQAVREGVIEQEDVVAHIPDFQEYKDPDYQVNGADIEECLDDDWIDIF